MRSVWFGLVCIIIGGVACGKEQVLPATAVAPSADGATVAADSTPRRASDGAAMPDPADAAAPPPVDTLGADSAPIPGDAPAADAVAPAGDAAAAQDVAAEPGDGKLLSDAGATPMPEPTGPPKPFDDMTEAEKKAHMKKVVVPVMRPRLQAFDSEEFAEVKCKTCHGPGVVDGKFDMPNEELFKLPKTPDGFRQLAEKKPEAMKFMKDVVVPAMAKMLGEAPYDPATHKGFGCMHCHVQKQD